MLGHTRLHCSGSYWAVLGHTGLYWAILGCTGTCRVVWGCAGLHCSMLGYTCVVLDTQVYVAPHRSLQGHTALWRTVVHAGLHWSLLGCGGLYCTILGCTAAYKATLGCTRLYWNILVCTYLYCTVLDPAGPFRALLPIHTWVVPGSTGTYGGCKGLNFSTLAIWGCIYVLLGHTSLYYNTGGHTGPYWSLQCHELDHAEHCSMQDCTAPCWALEGCTAPYRAELDCVGSYWAAQGWPGSYWSILACIAPYRAPLGHVLHHTYMGSTRQRGGISGYMGLQRTALQCTGSYWAVLVLYWATWVCTALYGDILGHTGTRTIWRPSVME